MTDIPRVRGYACRDGDRRGPPVGSNDRLNAQPMLLSFPLAADGNTARLWLFEYAEPESINGHDLAPGGLQVKTGERYSKDFCNRYRLGLPSAPMLEPEWQAVKCLRAGRPDSSPPVSRG